MGLFSKKKPVEVSKASEEQILKVITKFQNLLPDTFETEINGKNYDSSKLNAIVDKLVRVANQNEDRQLLQFVAHSCVVASSEFGELSVEEIAKTIFNGLGVSGEIRNRYSSNHSIVDDVTALGVASVQIIEENPKYPEVLDFLSENAEKLANE